MVGQKRRYAKNIFKVQYCGLAFLQEGLPKVLSEAAACGKPIVTTDVPGCKDAIIDRSTGLLVALKDSKSLPVQ